MKWRVGRDVAVPLAIVVLLLPCGAQAEGTDEVGSNEIKWGKVFDLAACALSVATIETGVGAAAAFITCGKAASEWWTE
jgi:hypothetical protein